MPPSELRRLDDRFSFTLYCKSSLAAFSFMFLLLSFEALDVMEGVDYKTGPSGPFAFSPSR